VVGSEWDMTLKRCIILTIFIIGSKRKEGIGGKREKAAA